MDAKNVKPGSLYKLKKAWTDETLIVVVDKVQREVDGSFTVWGRYLQGVDSPDFVCRFNPDNLFPIIDRVAALSSNRGSRLPY